MSAVRSSPHLGVPPSVSGVMRDVLLALIPGVLLYVAWFGPSVLVSISLAVVAALATEAALLRARGRALKPFLGDLSAVVTAVLLALALPPSAPWWIPVLGAVFAISLGKQVFGGLGYNPFNPAMVGYIVLLISFPAEMTIWPAAAPLWGEAAAAPISAAFSGVDGWAGATALDQARTQLGLGLTLTEIRELPAHGLLAGRGWDWVSLGFLAGGLWLLWRRHIGWQIPVGVLAGLCAFALLFWLIDSDRYASPLFHAVGGATLLGAFFIATDPVSAATTPRGRLLFGLGIGALTYIIRTWGGYPDAIAFAVLLMNIAVPLIDRYTKPRVFGQVRREQL